MVIHAEKYNCGSWLKKITVTVFKKQNFRVKSCASVWISIWGAWILLDCGLPDKMFWNSPSPPVYTRFCQNVEVIVGHINGRNRHFPFTSELVQLSFESCTNRSSVLQSNIFHSFIKLVGAEEIPWLQWAHWNLNFYCLLWTKEETFENDRVPGMNHAEKKKTTVSFGQGHKMKLWL